MCTLTIVLCLATVLVDVFVVHWYWTENQNAVLEAEVISPLLEQSQIKRGIFSVSIDGYYKGRQLRWCYSIDNDGCITRWYIKPMQLAHPQPLFMLRYPKPTTNTQLRGSKIYFNNAEKFDYQTILDELTESALIIEKELK